MQGPPADSRIAVADQYGWSESWSRYNTESTWALLDTLFAVAEDAGRTPARVAINWLLQRPLVTAPIIGVRSMEQLEATLAAAGWALTQAQIDRLDRASSPGYPYPYENVASLHIRR